MSYMFGYKKPEYDNHRPQANPRHRDVNTDHRQLHDNRLRLNEMFRVIFLEVGWYACGQACVRACVCPCVRACVCKFPSIA